MRRRVYEILIGRPAGDSVARAINGLLLLLIAVNVTASVIETDVQLRQRAPELFL